MSRLLKPTEPSNLIEIASRLGIPFAILLIVFFQLTPRIDRQVEIADRTAAYLGVLIARPMCTAP